ncbi:HNH endonuclease [Streptomyces sp. NPDC007063]|uniref:HNH endonuclease n=1 Tax=Streptomyces sp. NPDC007063 TaxID=3364772 RepID=UPI003696AC26
MALSAKGYPIPVAKRCAGCQATKPIEAFTPNASYEDGRPKKCRACDSRYNRKYVAKNAVKRHAYFREYSRQYRTKNAKHTQRYYQENKERYAASGKRWRQNNPDKARTYNAKRRALKRNARHEPYSRTDIFARWDSLCAYCDAIAEHLDHVYPLSRGGADAAHNLVPACQPCNSAKGAKTLAEWAATFGPEHGV